MLAIFRKPKPPKQVCKLRIGRAMLAVDDPAGLGLYQLALEKLIREEAPDIIYLQSDDPNDLSVVRKALAYFGERGGEIVVASQLSDEEVAAALGVSVDLYTAAVADPDGSAFGFSIETED